MHDKPAVFGLPALWKDTFNGLSAIVRHAPGSVMGLIGSELNWEAEALRVAHGGLLQTLASLYNAYHKTGTEFNRINELIKDFYKVWKEHVAARDKNLERIRLSRSIAHLFDSGFRAALLFYQRRATAAHLAQSHVEKLGKFTVAS